ncbi:holotricin-3-like, partial [Penaeus monodon]|uniref:holotricin-3-like n=1 Tax=Penaeus monodon TaxID=6687 RepID=UPI0018A7963C
MPLGCRPLNPFDSGAEMLCRCSIKRRSRLFSVTVPPPSSLAMATFKNALVILCLGLAAAEDSMREKRGFTGGAGYGGGYGGGHGGSGGGGFLVVSGGGGGGHG